MVCLNSNSRQGVEEWVEGCLLVVQGAVGREGEAVEDSVAFQGSKQSGPRVCMRRSDWKVKVMERGMFRIIGIIC